MCTCCSSLHQGTGCDDGLIVHHHTFPQHSHTQTLTCKHTLRHTNTHTHTETHNTHIYTLRHTNTHSNTHTSRPAVHHMLLLLTLCQRSMLWRVAELCGTSQQLHVRGMLVGPEDLVIISLYCRHGDRITTPNNHNVFFYLKILHKNRHVH